LKKHRPHYIAGVPTLYEALLRLEGIGNLDMSRLEGVFCGGDTLPVDLRRRVDEFLQNHGAKVQIREGYGMTESVTVSCLTPPDYYREGSVGIPYPDMYYKIAAQDGADELPPGEVGEICVSGPSVMIGYNNEPEETKNVLRTHNDGKPWLHTGDAGMMDDEGFIYFRQRIKRMIVSAGYNIYPNQVENVLDSHASVLSSCVIGVPDEIKVQSVKAYVVLKDGVKKDEQTEQHILKHCKDNMVRYAVPSKIEFIGKMPMTKMGKVAYKELEELEKSKKDLPTAK
ncbi:MAG: AMP-binding protein, partial [Methanomassiliicoccaceae archaeon]|nr:AMP-binding protein [Methanomassiliicoccaceae archaeon]